MSKQAIGSQPQGETGEAAQVGERQKAKRSPRPRVRLDLDIEDVLVAATDVQRALNRELKGFTRGQKLSERGLYIIHMVNAGLNRPSLLIDYFDVLPSTITVEVDKLVAARLMTRQAAAFDRRVMELALTEKGQAVRLEALAVLNRTFRPRLDETPRDDVRICVETLRKIVQPLAPETPRASTEAGAPGGPRRSRRR
jgi:DNA-binding MarR family transcriptional regulator